MKTNEMKGVNETKWEENFQLLLKYKEINSTAHVPSKLRTSNSEWKKLSIWCATQKEFNREGVLKSERYERLKAIGFNFTSHESDLDSRIEDLKNFKKKYGHYNVPLECTEFSNLGKWISLVRNRFNSVECINKLNLIGFDWDLVDKVWLKKYYELLDYKDKFGNLFIKNKKFHMNLYNWMSELRKAKKTGKKEFLSTTKINLLDDIGFPWEKIESKWEKNFNKLKEFTILKGHCIVPSYYGRDPGLARWVSKLRQSKANLSEEQIKLLDSLGFEWDGKFAQRRRNEILRKLKSENKTKL